MQRKAAPTATNIPTSDLTVALAMPPFSHDIVAGSLKGTLIRLATHEAMCKQDECFSGQALEALQASALLPMAA